MGDDAMQQAQAHCRDLQERYRQLVAEGTALKADKFSLEKQLVREGEERARWEKELAESQVAVLLVEKDIEARTCCLQGLKDEREACSRIRIHLAALDLKCNEQNSAHWNFILNLPDSFYNGAALKHKVELQSLKHQLADATEQEEQRIALERRLSASINDNEQLSSMLQKTEQAILEAEQKMKDAEAEQDCMAFMREEALATKRSELDRVTGDLMGLGSCIDERQAELNALKGKEASIKKELEQLRCRLEHAAPWLLSPHKKPKHHQQQQGRAPRVSFSYEEER